MFENKLASPVGTEFLSPRLEYLKELLVIAVKRSDRNVIKTVLDHPLGWNTTI